MTDISFLANVDGLFGKSISFTYINGAVYMPIIKVEEYTEIDTPTPDPKPTHITVTVPFKGQNIDIEWDDDWFSHSSYEYNNDIAKAALVLGGTAESKSDGEIRQVLSAMGFRYVWSRQYDTYANIQAPAYVIASKQIKINGIIKELISITVRGTTTFEDIINDIYDGAQGFVASKDFVLDGFNNYLEFTYGSKLKKENVILFISGHSLGGATASSLATNLNDSGRFDSENIFTYTFAPPSYLPNTTNVLKKYGNIFEILDYNDPITHLGGPLSRHAGATRRFSPDLVKNFPLYYEKCSGKKLPIINPFDYHACTTYMAFLLSDGGTPTVTLPYVRYLVSVRCPVDVEIYDNNGILLARVTDNMLDESVTSDKVYCKIEGDKKFFFIDSDNEVNVKLVGTDTGEMEYTVQCLADVDEPITESDIIAHKNVVLEKGKVFYSEITEQDDETDVTLYVIDPDTDKPIKTVDTDGTEKDIDEIFTVTFNSNGGTTTPASAKTNESGKLEALPTTTRNGYTFDGWFTAAENGEKITADTVFTKDTTVFAHWTRNTGSSDSSDLPNTSDVPSSGSGEAGSSADTSSDIDKPAAPDASSDTTSDNVTDSTSDSSHNADPSNSTDPSASNNGNPSTGVTAAVIPILLAAAASVVIFRRKHTR